MWLCLHYSINRFSFRHNGSRTIRNVDVSSVLGLIWSGRQFKKPKFFRTKSMTLTFRHLLLSPYWELFLYSCRWFSWLWTTRYAEIFNHHNQISFLGHNQVFEKHLSFWIHAQLCRKYLDMASICNREIQWVNCEGWSEFSHWFDHYYSSIFIDWKNGNPFSPHSRPHLRPWFIWPNLPMTVRRVKKDIHPSRPGVRSSHY